MTAHSDKGIETMARMGTVASDWRICDFRWVEEERYVACEVTCPTCSGDRAVVTHADGSPFPKPAHPDYRIGVEAYKAQMEVCSEYRKALRLIISDAWSRGNCPTCIRRKKYNLCTGKAVGKMLAKVMVGYPIWEEGASFDSRFGGGCTCGLCGKTILKSNLVPVTARGANGKAHGLLVGSDCAKKIFSIKSPAKEGVRILEVGI